MGRLKKVGEVTREEALTIYKIFMRQKALEELDLISEKLDSILTNKLYQEIAVTTQKFDNWWNDIANKYCLESQENCQWEIDFDTYEIFLTQQL